MNETPSVILWSAADAIDAETAEAYPDVFRRYGYAYAQAWLAGRQQAAEEIRNAI